MLSLFVLILIAVGVVVWVVLDRREKARVSQGLPRHAGIRLVFAAAAALVMLFSGGCSLIFLASMSQSSRGEQYVNLPVIMVLGGPPFLVGVLVWWLVMRRKRNPGPSGSNPL